MILQVLAQPGAKSAGAAPRGEDMLRIRVSARAVDGHANDALCAWVATKLGLPQSSVRIVRGAASRRKSIQAQVARFDPEAFLNAAKN